MFLILFVGNYIKLFIFKFMKSIILFIIFLVKIYSFYNWIKQDLFFNLGDLNLFGFFK